MHTELLDNANIRDNALAILHRARRTISDAHVFGERDIRGPYALTYNIADYILDLWPHYPGAAGAASHEKYAAIWREEFALWQSKR